MHSHFFTWITKQRQIRYIKQMWKYVGKFGIWLSEVLETELKRFQDLNTKIQDEKYIPFNLNFLIEIYIICLLNSFVMLYVKKGWDSSASPEHIGKQN